MARAARIAAIDELYERFGFDEVRVELSTRPEKSIGTAEQWDQAEEALRTALETQGRDYQLNPGDGAFYGPKIDFHVTDALGLPVSPSARLRHVAHLGVRTRDFAFFQHGLDAPPEAFRVELTAPDGTVWCWGPEDAAQRVSGPALDFCLVVTRRRHVADTRLAVSGPVAEEWMLRAQAYAGPPGSGRRPGQFPRPT